MSDREKLETTMLQKLKEMFTAASREPPEPVGGSRVIVQGLDLRKFDDVEDVTIHLDSGDYYIDTGGDRPELKEVDDAE